MCDKSVYADIKIFVTVSEISLAMDMHVGTSPTDNPTRLEFPNSRSSQHCEYTVPEIYSQS